MSALKYRDRVRIERLAPPSGEPNDPDYGAGPEIWQMVVEVWAEVRDNLPSKAEATDEGIRLARDAARVRIRYRDGITPDMRLVELTGSRRTLAIIAGPAVITGRTEIEMMVERFSS